MILAIDAMQTNTEQYEIRGSYSGLVEKPNVLECYTIPHTEW